MYQSKKCLEKKGTPALKEQLNDFLKKHTFLKCKALKGRKVFFNKLPEVITCRKDVKNRLECFPVSIDILKKAPYFRERLNNKKKEYEIGGLSAEGKRVFIHLREEIIRKDKKLFLVSTYHRH